MRGSREISLVPSLHRASTDALIIWQNPDIHVSGSPMNPYHITLTIFHGLHDATDVHANCNINIIIKSSIRATQGVYYNCKVCRYTHGKNNNLFLLKLAYNLFSYQPILAQLHVVSGF